MERPRQNALCRADARHTQPMGTGKEMGGADAGERVGARGCVKKLKIPPCGGGENMV
jgi:hypothetical protein